MGVPSSPGQAPPRIVSHSIGFYFGTGLIAPVSCLLVRSQRKGHGCDG